MGAIRDQANAVYANGPDSAPTEPKKGDIRNLFGVVEDEVSAAAAGITVKATWAELAAITGTRDGQPGRVTGPDAGTHTDPVVGGTVDNVGEFAWDTGDSGWQRVGDLLDVSGEMASAVDGSASKTTPVDADTIGLVDSAASNALKKLTWANLKAGVWAGFGALIAGGTEKTAPVAADTLPLSDSAASGASKKVTVTNLLAPETVRGGAAVSMHSINITDGRADKNGNDWIVSWTTCRAVIGSALATINDLATTTLASNELLYIDVAGGSTPYTAVKATNSPGLRNDFRDGKKLLLLFNWGAGLLVGAMADTLKTVAAAPLLDALSAETDLIYIGSGNYGDLSVDPKGVIVQGINLTTGLPIVTGGGGGGLVDPSLIVITRSANNLYIHMPQADGTYVRWRFTRLTNAGQNSDVWQVYGIDHASLAGGSSSTIQSICDTGQVEIALQRTVDAGAFLIGGNAHGNDEMLADPIMLVDGVAVDITTGTETITCKRLEIFQASQLMSPDDSSDVAKRYTRWLFEDGGLDLTNHLVFEAAVEFAVMYLAMLSVRRLDGATQITDEAVRSPLFYPVEDVSGAHAGVYTDAAHIKVWGDDYAAEVEILEGWEDADRESWISSGVNRNKLYFSPTGVNRSGAVRSHTTSISDVMRVRSRMRVSV